MMSKNNSETLASFGSDFKPSKRSRFLDFDSSTTQPNLSLNNPAKVIDTKSQTHVPFGSDFLPPKTSRFLDSKENSDPKEVQTGSINSLPPIKSRLQIAKEEAQKAFQYPFGTDFKSPIQARFIYKTKPEMNENVENQVENDDNVENQVEKSCSYGNSINDVFSKNDQITTKVPLHSTIILCNADPLRFEQEQTSDHLSLPECNPHTDISQKSLSECNVKKDTEQEVLKRCSPEVDIKSPSSSESNNEFSIEQPTIMEKKEKKSNNPPSDSSVSDKSQPRYLTRSQRALLDKQGTE